MSAAPSQTNPLVGLIEALSEKELKKLAARIELDRNFNKYGLPHDALMRLMRPRLALMRAPRVFTTQRILCLPFEDLLIFDDPDVKERGKIARASIMPFWKWVTEEVMPQSFPALSEAFLNAQKQADEAATKRAAADIWQKVADEIQPRLDELQDQPEMFRTLAKHLGGSKRLEDITEIVKVLHIASEIETVKASLPRKPIRALTDDQVTMIQRHYESVSEQKPGCEVELLLVVIGRLLQPYPILRVLRALTPKKDDRLISRTEMGIAGEIVIEAIEADAETLEEKQEDMSVSETELIRLARRFADAFNGVTNDFGIRRDGDWGQRMFAARGRVGAVMEYRVLSDAALKIAEVLPGKKGKMIPDFRAAPDEEKFMTAERRARALGDLMRMADQVGVQSKCNSVVADLRKSLDIYGSQMLDKLGRVDPVMQDNGMLHLCTAARLIELIANSDEGDILRRRGFAAMDITLHEKLDLHEEEV